MTHLFVSFHSPLERLERQDDQTEQRHIDALHEGGRPLGSKWDSHKPYGEKPRRTSRARSIRNSANSTPIEQRWFTVLLMNSGAAAAAMIQATREAIQAAARQVATEWFALSTLAILIESAPDRMAAVEELARRHAAHLRFWRRKPRRQQATTSWRLPPSSRRPSGSRRLSRRRGSWRPRPPSASGRTARGTESNGSSIVRRRFLTGGTESDLMKSRAALLA
jgi:hypothetical protein